MTTISTTITHVLMRFSIPTLAVVLTGCPDEEEGMGTGGDTGAPSMCDECAAMNRPYATCKCEGHPASNGCWLNRTECQMNSCDLKDPPVDVETYAALTCLSHDDVGSCVGWSPSAHITYVTATQTYEIDQSWVDGLTQDFGMAPIWTCDDAGFASAPGGFKVVNANAGEFVYQVGLRNNDQVQTINGINVKTWAGAEAAWGQYLGGGTQFNAVVKRGSNNITLKWKLVP